MIRKHQLLLLLFIFGCHPAIAQDIKQKPTDLFDISLAASKSQLSVAGSWIRLHQIGKKGRIEVGYGIRFTSFTASNKLYTTAPAKYTSPRQDIFTIFSKTFTENIDTIRTSTTVTHSLNATFNIQFRAAPRFDVGFNIDVVGFSFGPRKNFKVISSSLDLGQNVDQQASPTRFNLLLTSDNDIGSLNSEFFARYWITPKVAIKGGYTFLFNEYRTDRDLSFDNGRIVNDRYRYKSSMAMISITFKPF